MQVDKALYNATNEGDDIGSWWKHCNEQKTWKHNVINEGVAHKGARNWNEQWSSQSHNIIMKELKRICTKEVRKEIGTTYKTTCDDGSYKSKAQKIFTMVVVFCNQRH
jgi:hypothetical protein